MYSVVLMMAVTSPVDLPNCHRRRGGHSHGSASYSSGCGSASYSSCGDSCGGCGTVTSDCGSPSCEVIEGGSSDKHDDDDGDDDDDDGATDGGEGQSLTPTEAPARIVVNLPADSKLLIGGKATSSTQSRRVFVSPKLRNGVSYHYTITAEFSRGGMIYEFTRDIPVKAGQVTTVNFK